MTAAALELAFVGSLAVATFGWMALSCAKINRLDRSERTAREDALRRQRDSDEEPVYIGY